MSSVGITADRDLNPACYPARRSLGQRERADRGRALWLIAHDPDVLVAGGAGPRSGVRPTARAGANQVGLASRNRGYPTLRPSDVLLVHALSLNSTVPIDLEPTCTAVGLCSNRATGKAAKRVSS